MLRDNPVGLIEPMFSSAGANPLALCIARQKSSDDRPPCLENPRPEGAESTLTENSASPFHAEPKHGRLCLYNKKINLTVSLAGQAVGVKEVDDGIWLVSFMEYDLGYIDLEDKTLQPLQNPFGPKV